MEGVSWTPTQAFAEHLLPCVLWYTAWEQASHPSQPQWGCASFLSLLPLGSGAHTELCAGQVSDPLPGHLALTASGFTPTPSSWGFRVFLEGSLGRERPSPAFPGQGLADSTEQSCQGFWSQTGLSSNPWVTLDELLPPLQFPHL